MADTTWTRAQLEAMSIGDLRGLAEAFGLTTRKKGDIIAALASDYRDGPVAVTQAPSAPSAAPAPAAPAPQTLGESLVWPEVPTASCEVNGDYIEPPWFGELVAAAEIGHVELMGPAGSGKTLAVHHLAAVQGRRMAVVTADGGLRKRDLVGQRELVAASTTFLVAEYAAAAASGAWALIDEANMAEADALGFLNGMLDRPGTTGSTFSVGGRAIDVHPDFRCFITRNPGYQGTKLMNEALRDRFWSIDVPPLLEDGLMAMLASHGVPSTVAAEAAYLVGVLYQAWERNRISYQISPRRALSAAQMAKCISTQYPLEQYRGLLSKSILTKIDAKHERETVREIISAAWTARDATAAAQRRQA